MNEFSIRAGDLVDCLDADLIWSLGKVKEINRGRGEAQVGYYGWGAEWDEWISLSASRLAPPTTYSSSSLCFVKLPRGPTWPAKVRRGVKPEREVSSRQKTLRPRGLFPCAGLAETPEERRAWRLRADS
eukprot:scaffold2544_cov245-Pinguiococcus_pyrenoidosus.AAC.11